MTHPLFEVYETTTRYVFGRFDTVVEAHNFIRRNYVDGSCELKINLVTSQDCRCDGTLPYCTRDKGSL